LFIHSKDAAKMHLSEGQVVTVTSSVGKVKIPVEITNKILQGVVSIPHGWGHHRKGTNLEIAQQHPGVSINDLTNPKNMDVLTGNADFSSTKVKIERV
jgi:anaerobic selenocysteine-containing dehydrogenase